MILPTIVSVSLDALNAVPKSYYEGALALGATSEQSVFRVMLPAAKSGVLAAVVLAVGRAIGETMAVVMVIGNSPVMPRGLFQSVRTLTANIALGARELSGDAETALVATGVVLFFFVLVLNISFSLLSGGEKREKKTRTRYRYLNTPQSNSYRAPHLLSVLPRFYRWLCLSLYGERLMSICSCCSAITAKTLRLNPPLWERFISS
jgi:ABC-type uncharacterized transport system permease subunit